MKALSIFFLIAFSCVSAQAQFKDNVLDKPSRTRLDSYDDIIRKDRISYKNTAVRETGKPALSFRSLDFSIIKEDYFKLLRTDTRRHAFWMTGLVAQANSKSVPNPAEYWMDAASHHLGLDDPRMGFDLLETWEDVTGHTHYRMVQQVDGIAVYNAEILLHGQDDRIGMMNGIIIPAEKCRKSDSGLIDKDKAHATVRQALERYDENSLEFGQLRIKHDKDQWQSRLVYYPSGDIYIPAYHIVVYANDAERYEYFIDASNGQAIDSFQNICRFHNHTVSPGNGRSCNPAAGHKPDEAITLKRPVGTGSLLDGPSSSNAPDLGGSSRLINTYELGSDFFLIDASRDMFRMSASNLPDDPVGAIWTIDLNNTSPVNQNSLYTHVTSGDNSWTDTPEGVSAHYNAGLAYEYFKETFGRESITGTGQSIISFVNVADEFENSMGNAFWNGIGIYYGNGDAAFESLGRGLDVAGHEMSHGVIESTANLEYRNESGALNEAFADIFGAMIDRDDWLIGEDVVKTSAFPSGALRDMEDPHNGAATGDFGSGWQPRHYDERFTGSEDNGGVHINSGIINHAYYLFAQETGRDVAEQVFYRALTTYLLRSSDFRELRFAVIQSANDLYGQTVINAVASAFDQVGILDGDEIDTVADFDINPGQDLLLVSDQDLSQLYLFNLQTGEEIYNPLSTTPVLSKPSITDDGSRIVFVGQDNHIHLIDLDWTFDPPAVAENIISQTPDWRNAVISKNGQFLALLENIESNQIIVYDLLNDDVNAFQLTNPTYSEGVNTGEVRYADVMEFDATSTSIMYDAYNEVRGNTGTLEFWDVGFVEVWNPQFDTWALGNIEKLFGNLPEGVNIGNPTFSKNSPYIIALDVFEGSDFEIVGINLETQDINSIFQNTGLGYPSFSRDDAFMIYDLEIFGYTDLGVLQLNADKISRVANSDDILLAGAKWGVWFSNGNRLLSGLEEQTAEVFGVKLMPNPARDRLSLVFDDARERSGEMNVYIHDMQGKLLYSKRMLRQKEELDLSGFDQGMYTVTLEDGKGRTTLPFIKI